jgi:NhaP-type Na+/H+ or K+/H+ antiporter
MPKVHFSFDGSLFLRVMLPLIVFHAALSIDKHALYELIVPIIVYACFGTFMSSALVAVIVHVGTAFAMPGRESFIFGALISSIDPIAILSVLSSIGMSNTDAIYVMIFGESLFNDGVAIVLYETLIRFLDESVEINGTEIWEATVHFVVVMVGSTLVGVLSGGCCTVYFYAMRGCQTPLVEVLIFICWALIPYYICDGLSWSGIVGIIAASIMMDMFVVGANTPEAHVSLDLAPGEARAASFAAHHEGSGGASSNINGNSSERDDNMNSIPTPSRREHRNRIFTRSGHLSAVARTHIGFVSEINSTLMETSIFAYLGLFLLSARYKWNLYLTFLAIVSCLVSRAIMIPVLSFFLNRFCGKNIASRRNNNNNNNNNGVPYGDNGNGNGDPSTPQRKSSHNNKVVDARMQIVMWFGGLRGAMSFALVENIPLYDASTGFGSRLKPELKAMTSASIIFSVFICGGSTFYLMQKLGMTPGASGGGSGTGNGEEDESLLELQPLQASAAGKRRSDTHASPQHPIKVSPEPTERKDSSSPGRSNNQHFQAFNPTRDASKAKTGGVRHR